MARKTATQKRIDELKALQAARGIAPVVQTRPAPDTIPAPPPPAVMATPANDGDLADVTPRLVTFAVDLANAQQSIANLKEALHSCVLERDEANAELVNVRAERLKFELEVSDLREQLEKAKKERDEADRAVDDLEKEKEELEGRLDAERIAARFHEFMRDERLVPDGHDYPLHCTGSVYQAALQRAAEWAVS